jgi:hypothetical protein
MSSIGRRHAGGARADHQHVLARFLFRRRDVRHDPVLSARLAPGFSVTA